MWICSISGSGHITQSLAPVPQRIGFVRKSGNGVDVHIALASTHSSTVQLFMSSHDREPGLMQRPMTQTSAPLQKTPSPAQLPSNSHAGASLQPIIGKHERPMGHIVSSGVFWHASIAATHWSRVHVMPSSHVGMTPAMQRPPESQRLRPLQKMPSSGQSSSRVHCRDASPPPASATSPSTPPPSRRPPGPVLPPSAHPGAHTPSTTTANPIPKPRRTCRMSSSSPRCTAQVSYVTRADAVEVAFCNTR